MIKKVLLTLAAAPLALAVAGEAQALTIVADTTYAVLSPDAEIDARINVPNAAFAKEIGVTGGSGQTKVLGGETYWYGSIALGDLLTWDGKYAFFYDAQEPSSKKEINVDDIIVAAAGNIVFDYDEVANGSILIEDASNPQDTDFGLLLAQSLFAGLTDTALVELYWQQSDDQGGPDEWATAGVAVSAVPLPAAGFLLLGGLGAAAAFGRRGRKS